MAAAPAFASTPLLGGALINNGSADTNYASPSHAVLLLTAGAGGTKVSQIDLIPAGTINSGGVVVNIYAYNGTSYYLFESVLVPAVTPGVQAASAKQSFYYENLVLPNGWFLYATETVISQEVQVNVFGASL